MILHFGPDLIGSAIRNVGGTPDLGPDFYQRRIDRARRTTHLLRQLHALGYEVQLTEPAA